MSEEWIESRVRPRWIDGLGYIAATVWSRSSWTESGVLWRFTKPTGPRGHSGVSGPSAPCAATVAGRDQHLTTVLPYNDWAWLDELGEPMEKLLEKEAYMRAACVQVRSEGSTSSSFTGRDFSATIRSMPFSRKSVPHCSERSVNVILPVSLLFDDPTSTVSHQNKLVRSVRSKSGAQTGKISVRRVHLRRSDFQNTTCLLQHECESPLLSDS